MIKPVATKNNHYYQDVISISDQGDPEIPLLLTDYLPYLNNPMLNGWFNLEICSIE